MAAAARLRRLQDNVLVAVAKVAYGSWGFSLASSYARRVSRRGEVDHVLFHTFTNPGFPDWHLTMVSSTHGERTALWHARALGAQQSLSLACASVCGYAWCV
jgi:hypothetical protein